jgi:hypothetical protein
MIEVCWLLACRSPLAVRIYLLAQHGQQAAVAQTGFLVHFQRLQAGID